MSEDYIEINFKINGDRVKRKITPSLLLIDLIREDGKELTTIEGLSLYTEDEIFDPVQEAIIKYGAVQCGYCTPGMVMSIKSFQEQCKEKHTIPNRKEIKKALEGNLCRCTGYTKIIDAVESLFDNPKS